MADLTPNNREEHFLQGMVDGETTLTPNNRKEHWYKEIIDSIGSGGGGGGGVLIVEMTLDADTHYATLNKTAGEIVAAFPLVFITFDTGSSVLVFNVSSYIETDIHTYCADGGQLHELNFEADSADDYPVAYMDE